MRLIQKHHIVLIFILFLVSCKTKQIILGVKNNDIYFVETKEKNVVVLFSIYNKNNFFIQKRGRSRDMVPRFKKGITLIQKTDTMQVLCFCGQEKNYYFKEIEFKKEVYFVSFLNDSPHVSVNKSVYEITGEKIKTPKSVHNVLFKNTLIHKPKEGYSHENLSFKDIKFKVINFSDTINVKLIPITKEEFWSNDFIPKNLKE